METKKKKLSMLSMLMLFSMVPLCSMIIILGIVSAVIMTKNVESNIREELTNAATSLQSYYEYDLINDNDLTDGFVSYETDYIDKIQKTGIDLTVFKKNIRFFTTIKDSSGKRIEGTESSPEVWAAVSKGEDYYSQDVVINGIDYYVYYLPMHDKNGEVAGMAFAGKPATDVQHNEKMLFIMLFVIGFTSAGIFAGIVIWLAKKVAHPLTVAANGFSEIASGNLNADFTAHTSIKESQKLLDSAQSLSNILGNIIHGISEKTDMLVVNSDNLNVSSTENAESIEHFSQAIDGITMGATSQAEEVQSAAGSVATAVESIENINIAVSKAQEAATEMNEDAGKVSEDFDVLLADIVTSIRSLSSITEKMDLVSRAVDNVNSAAGEINNIASQTNLLSLNASIEAARAGDAGRGFAVVAGEISSLSDQSDKAAKSIKDIMTNLESETKQAVDMVSKLSEIMKKQEENSTKSKESLTKLIAEIGNTKEQVALVKEGSDTVSDICDKLSEVIQNLSAISEENAASAQESAASVTQVSANTQQVLVMAGELKGIADNLKNIIGYFA